MAVGSGSGFYTLTPPGAQPQSLSHGPQMTLMPSVPAALGAERQDGGTVHCPHKLQIPKEENKTENNLKKRTGSIPGTGGEKKKEKRNICLEGGWVVQFLFFRMLVKP